MKKLIFGILVATLIMTSLVVQAEHSTVHAKSGVQSDDIRITIDGRSLFLVDQPPIIEDGRTLVPIRLVAESLGARVEWDPTTQTTTLERAGVEVSLTIGTTTAQVNGENVTLDVAPIILNGRTLLPVRFIAETFSQDVQWDAENRVIRITEDMTFAEGSNIREWLIGAGAIMGRVNAITGADPYFMGLFRRDVSGVTSARTILRGSWGANNREELLDVIYNIANYGHSLALEFDIALFNSLSVSEQEHVLRNAQGVDAFMWPYILYLDEKWGDKSIRAWDWFRVATLCRWGYTAGFITLEEAFIIFEPVAVALQATFESWDEAIENYLDGFAFWARVDVNNPTDQFTRRVEMFEDMRRTEQTDQRGLIFDPRLWEEPVRGIQ